MRRISQQPVIADEQLVGIQLNERALMVPSPRDRPYLRLPSFRQCADGGLVMQDREAFQSLDDIKKRHIWNDNSRQKSLGSNKFMSAFKGIQQTLIFDSYFDKKAMLFLRDCLDPPPHNLSHLFILTGHEFHAEVEPVFKELKLNLAMRPGRQRMVAGLLCELRAGSTPYPHDRFALLDGELWHFGATAGGIHGNVNAFSYGWRDEDVKFSAFFKAAWNHLDLQSDRVGIK